MKLCVSNFIDIMVHFLIYCNILTIINTRGNDRVDKVYYYIFYLYTMPLYMYYLDN